MLPTLRKCCLCVVALGAAVAEAQTRNLSWSQEIDRLMSRSDWDGAYAAAARAVAAHPNDALAYALLGDAAGTRAAVRNPIFLLSAAREVKRAYARALAIDSMNVRALEGHLGYLLEAPGILGGNREMAPRIVERIRAANPARGEIAALRALLRGGATSDSLQSRVARMVDVFPTDTFVLVAAGRFYENADGAADAVRIYQRLWSLDTTRAMTAFRLGLAYQWARDWTSAETWFLRAHRMERSVPGDSGWVGAALPAWALARLAARRVPEQAAAWADSVLTVAPNHSSALRMRDSLRVVARRR